MEVMESSGYNDNIKLRSRKRIVEDRNAMTFDRRILLGKEFNLTV
jgi:hypothetical protein